jgi:dTDP-4-amino-4,6-dideoxygalactose transaminase
MSQKIEFYIHNLTDEDITLAEQVLRSTFLTTGPRVAEFEKKLASYLEIKEVVGVTSCTGALHLALLRAGVGPGDEVITTPMSFVATATAILEVGAIPVFVDVNPHSALLEPEAVERALTKKTKAIVPVHLFGRMVDMIGFSKLGEKRNIAVIEDSAHCLEGVRDGVRPGGLSKAACFSFYATKNMTCGEGGAIACTSEEDAEWYKSARHHGISKNASYRYVQKYQHWDMEMMGWKYNMDDIQAALMIGQIDRLNQNNARRKLLDNLYREQLAGIEGLEFIDGPLEGEKSGHHLFTVLLPASIDRDETLHQLQDGGIGCAVNYRAIHVLKFFRETYGYKPEDFPVAHSIGSRTITLPLYPKLSEDSVITVCDALKRIIISLRTKTS